jgi:hypothetical protein
MNIFKQKPKTDWKNDEKNCKYVDLNSVNQDPKKGFKISEQFNTFKGCICEPICPDGNCDGSLKYADLKKCEHPFLRERDCYGTFFWKSTCKVSANKQSCEKNFGCYSDNNNKGSNCDPDLKEEEENKYTCSQEYVDGEDEYIYTYESGSYHPEEEPNVETVKTQELVCKTVLRTDY